MSLPYYSYGILVTLAYILGLYLFAKNCRKSGKKSPSVIDIGLIITICGIAGARIAYILLFPHQFNGLRDYLAIYEGGLVFYGGFIGAIAGLLIYSLCSKYNFGFILDMLVPSIAAGHSMGRIGCFINNCCYGAPTDLIHLYKLPGENFYRHPTQLYESLFLALSSVVFTFILGSEYRSENCRPGKTAAIYLCAYSLFRFAIEFIRDDSRGGFFTSANLSPSQLVSILLFFLGSIFLLYCHYKTTKQ